jgi:hypothetical protein
MWKRAWITMDRYRAQWQASYEYICYFGFHKMLCSFDLVRSQFYNYYQCQKWTKCLLRAQTMRVCTGHNCDIWNFLKWKRSQWMFSVRKGVQAANESRRLFSFVIYFGFSAYVLFGGSANWIMRPQILSLYRTPSLPPFPTPKPDFRAHW